MTTPAPLAEVQVATGDLRDALAAVTPHADPKEGRANRVRLLFDDQHVNVIAYNGLTAALAIVSIEDDTRPPGDDPMIVDLTPRQAKLVLEQFKPKGAGADDQLTALRILKDGDGLEVADVSGLFAGESIQFPHVAAADGFPDVLGLIRRALATASSEPLPRPLTSDGKILALFKAASEAYGEPLTIEAPGAPEFRAHLVSCGESFLGVVSSTHQDDDSRMARDKYRTGWMRRLLRDPASFDRELVDA